MPAIDEELEKLRAQLADLSSHYTDRHPDVRKLKQQIAETEKTRDQIVADLKAKASAPADPDDCDHDSGSLHDERRVVADGSIARAAAVQPGRDCQPRARGCGFEEQRLIDYQARLNQEPVREQQLADLTRGYEQSKANYDDLLKKKNESAMATSMELLQQGERFRIIDPPSLPVKPEFPNRLKFCGIGLGIGLALGVVVAGAFEMMDDRIYDEKELQETAAGRGDLGNSDDRGCPRMSGGSAGRLWIGWATAAFVSVTILVGVGIQLLARLANRKCISPSTA